MGIYTYPGQVICTFQGPALVFVKLLKQFTLKGKYATGKVLGESRNFAHWGFQLFLRLNKTSANPKTWKEDCH